MWLALLSASAAFPIVHVQPVAPAPLPLANFGCARVTVLPSPLASELAAALDGAVAGPAAATSAFPSSLLASEPVAANAEPKPLGPQVAFVAVALLSVLHGLLPQPKL